MYFVSCLTLDGNDVLCLSNARQCGFLKETLSKLILFNDLKCTFTFAASSTSALKKDAAVLKDTSFAVHSRELGALEKHSGLMLRMYLSVPNTTIVNIANAASDDGYSNVGDRTRMPQENSSHVEGFLEKHAPQDQRARKSNRACARSHGNGEIGNGFCDYRKTW